MHSLVIAEPVGIAIGVVAGRAGSKIGKKIAQQYNMPPFLGAMIGSFIAHYAVSAIVKGLINAGLLDIPGAATNVAVTSPIAAGAHGLIEGVLEFLPNLQDLIGDEISKALPDMMHDVATNIDGDNFHHSGLGFGHSIQPIEIIADLQQGPTCGIETIENMVQAAFPNVTNDFSQTIISHLRLSGIDFSKGLPMDLYENILGACDLGSAWIPFDHHQIVSNLGFDTGSVAITGDPFYIRNTYDIYGNPHFINYQLGGQPHAIVLTDTHNGYYAGVDSNSSTPLLFTPKQIEDMSIKGGIAGKYHGQILLSRKM